MSNAKRVAWAAAALLGLSVSSVAFASTAPTPVVPGKLAPAGNAEAGATKAAVCTACHGPNGNSANPEWPTLAGQNAAYIREQLTLFRAGQRNNPVMYPMAQPLIPGPDGGMISPPATTSTFELRATNGFQAASSTFQWTVSFP